ncbi:hypothetical protein RclHR1_02090007 [Rhizophagus clarus]|uniref:Long-chain-alcohol O-fatty-acyltransferase-like n=1 Tax=Rhizophagus clarus TaxID=94130 RepID=A0A2Z6QR90_9GLOM|nr:hypothetical protein RclHR1_02090007 [Rhizophagus clarus]GES87719.1 long-chain-alcohol O-fatty-acyltransferase-like [Rhizophagus clarus]
MLLDSQYNIFTKSNLVYIPLSITIAHTLNFIVNSPLSTWKEFPPRLPNSVYSSLFLTPLLLFMSLTFEPIQTRKRFYTLLSLALLVVLIPLSYHGREYPPPLKNAFVAIAVFHGLKMFLFLKFNRVYLNQKNSEQNKEFKSYILTFFNWRPNSYIIPPIANEKENLSINNNSPTTSQINKKLINRLMIFIAKYLIFEFSIFTLIISTKCKLEVSEKAYQIRLVEFITSGIPPFTLSSMRLYLNFIGIMYLWLSLNYDFITIIVSIIFRFFFHSTPENNNYKSILIQSGLLTPSEYVSLKEWIITFLFNTKHLFSEPWMSSSPRDFWSTRWQLLINEGLKELGYYPVKNLFTPIFSKKIANIMGVLGAFGVSALLHEYLIIANFNVWTGEQFFFFMMHGVIFILWEAIFNNKSEDTKITKFLKWFLLLNINLILLPGLIEPSLRNFKFSDISSVSSYFAKEYLKF